MVAPVVTLSHASIVLRSALVTLLGVGGSIAASFLSIALSFTDFAIPGTTNGRALTVWSVVLGIALVILPPFVGGAVWGGGIALIFGFPVRSVAKTGALAFGGMILATFAPVHLTQLWLDDLPDWMPWGIHGYFTVVFMVEVALVASIAAWRVAKRLGAKDAGVVGAWTGGAAAVGLLGGSILAVALGFNVHPGSGFAMVWALLTAVPVSALAAGATLGFLLERGRHTSSRRESG
jgi:hypothetical protein